MKIKKLMISYDGSNNSFKPSFIRFVDQTKSWYDAYAKRSYTTARVTHVSFTYNKTLHWLVYP